MKPTASIPFPSLLSMVVHLFEGSEEGGELPLQGDKELFVVAVMGVHAGQDQLKERLLPLQPCLGPGDAAEGKEREKKTEK